MCNGLWILLLILGCNGNCFNGCMDRNHRNCRCNCNLNQNRMDCDSNCGNDYSFNTNRECVPECNLTREYSSSCGCVRGCDNDCDDDCTDKDLFNGFTNVNTCGCDCN